MPAVDEMTPLRCMCLSLAVLSACSGPAAGAQQVVEAEEHEVRAALLYNFARFVTWPASVFAHGRSPFLICVLGEDRVVDALAEIAQSKQVRGRRLVSRTFDAADDVTGCHILFYSLGELGELERHRSRWTASHVLTVGEVRGFAAAGGVVGLSIVENHFTFEVNARAARQAELEISASLLDLAVRVIDEDRR